MQFDIFDMLHTDVPFFIEVPFATPAKDRKKEKKDECANSCLIGG